MNFISSGNNISCFDYVSIVEGETEISKETYTCACASLCKISSIAYKTDKTYLSNCLPIKGKINTRHIMSLTKLARGYQCGVWSHAQIFKQGSQSSCQTSGLALPAE